MTFSYGHLAWILLTVFGAYVVFGLAGFGSALVAAPLLVHLIPVPFVIPLLALLDFMASTASGLKLGQKIAWREVFVMVPMMMVGNCIGLTLLLHLPVHLLSLLLGIFIVGYALYALYGVKTVHLPSRRWAVVFGTGAGLLGSLFGSGGIAYSIYLSGRLNDKDAIRATMATLIGINTCTRALMFLIAGLYANRTLLYLALLMLPLALLGAFFGHRVSFRMSRRQFLRAVNLLLVLSGGSLIWRYLAGA